MAAKIIGPNIVDPNMKFLVSYVDGATKTWKARNMNLTEVTDWASRVLPDLVERGSTNFLIQQTGVEDK